MEASLLVAPKPSMCMTRCIVASAGKDTDRNLIRRRTSRTNYAQQLAVAASTTAASATIQSQPAAASPEQLVVVGDLDPATAAAAAMGAIGPGLSAMGFLFIARIVMSWYPRLPVREFPYVVAYAPTEPILAATRKVIPPVGGVDVTPVVWFAVVSFLNEILVGPQGLLVLLSQQKP
uniref:Protein COFACTOR ASSEMBLY OF COMPLEX C SUBUNIT B CCB3, chloroplastic n=1 Tax=Leersia perrieri TaxID=77586 RepID=A0A0D9VAQ4_9ORYZ